MLHSCGRATQSSASKSATTKNPHDDAGVSVPDKPGQCSCGKPGDGKWCDEPPSCTVYFCEKPEEIVWYCKDCAQRKLMEHDAAVDLHEW